MKTKFFRLAMASVIAIFMFGSLSAQPPGACRMVDSIPGITKEQKVKIAALRESNRIDMDELHAKKQAATTWDEKDKIDHQMIDTRAKLRNEVRALLTPEQQKYFDQNFEKQCEKGRPHDGKGPGRFGKGERHEKHEMKECDRK